MSSPVTVAVDAMGGDHAPAEVVAGALLALDQDPGLAVILVGREPEVSRALDGRTLPGRLTVVHAPEVIQMDEAATAVRRKREASIVVAMDQVKAGAAQAVVAAGSTGAAMSAALFRLGRVPGIERPAIAVTFPGARQPFLMLDMGANVDCKPEWLVQFAEMGAAYARGVLGRKPVRVGLLNIGEEAGKGNDLTTETHERLAARTPEGWEFVGNVEGRAIWQGDWDVVVADGFAGNTVLKTAEGVAAFVTDLLKQELGASLRSRVGALLALPAFKALKARTDPATYGGALLLGINGVCVISHGSSRRTAIANAIKVAKQAVTGQYLEHLRTSLDAQGAQP